MELFGDYVMEACAASGTNDYTLGGPPANSPYIGAVAEFTTGKRVAYIVISDVTFKSEVGWGVVTAGNPATLTRNVKRSWDGISRSESAKINWSGADGALRMFCAPAAWALHGAVTHHRGTTAPIPAIEGMIWEDITDLTAVVWKHFDGTNWIALPWVINETTNRVTINEHKGADIASASSIDLGAADGNFVDITGTTTIAALGTAAAGVRRTVRFIGALTLTYNAASLILPGGVNISTVAGDSAEFWSLGSGNWICVRYTRGGVGNDPMPVGTPLDWPTDTPPNGFLVRDGALISRTTYAALFNVLVTQPGFTGQTFTVTIASPGVVTRSAHGFTGGERLRLSTTGALPTGLNTTDDFFVIYVDANTFRLATTEANAAAGTAINTSGSQSGTHTYLRSLYGLGDGSTTFRLPDDRGMFTRGKAASGRAIGSYQADAMQGHRHALYMDSGPATSLQTRNSLGADEGVAKVNNGAGSPSNPIGVADPITDSLNGTPRTASETRPANRAYLPIIKY